MRQKMIKGGGFQKVLISVSGLFLSFLVCGLMLLCFHINPIQTYVSIFTKAFGKSGITQTILSAVPIMIVAAGIDFGRRAGIFNLGAEGQMIAGAVGAQIVGLLVGDLPILPAVALTLLGGVFFGALWALIPTALKTFAGANEIVVLIMMNQIAIYLLGWLVRGPLKDPGSSNNQGKMIPQNAWLPTLMGNTKIHIGLLAAILLLLLLRYLLKKTAFGYQVAVVGNSGRSADYAGMSAKRTIFITFLISGAIAGLAGANQVAGVHHRLTGAISNNFGWTGLTVTMISGENPIVMIIISILYSALDVGGLIIQVTDKVPMQLADIIQAITVLFVICAQSIAVLRQDKKQRAQRQKLLIEREA